MRTANRPRYRRSILPAELRKGLRVIDVQSGFFVYTRDAVKLKGGYTDKALGPLFDIRKNQYEQ